MRKLYLLVYAGLLCSVASAQFTFGTFYSLSVPQKEMADNIKPVHSFNVSFLYQPKGICDRLSFGAEVGIGSYAHVTREQTIIMADSTSITTDVIYSSNVFNAALFFRGNILTKGKVIPYVTAKGGYSSFFSNVYVEDPEDETGCKALERKNIIGDNTFYWSYGGGLQVDLNLLAKKVKQGRYHIDIAVTKIKGGDLDYINTKRIQSQDQIGTGTDPATSEKGEPFNVQFVNVNTQSIHEHQVAEIYNSPLRMIDIRIGMLFRLQ